MSALNDAIDKYIAKKEITDDEVKLISKGLNSVVNSSVKSYGASRNDLATIGKTRAWRALKSWDKSKGVKLNTYLHGQLKSLYNANQITSNALKLPQRFSYERRKATDLMDSYKDKNGIEPSAEWIGEKMGVSAKKAGSLLWGKNEVSSSQMNSEETGDNLVVVTGSDETRDSSIWNAVYTDSDEKSKKIIEFLKGYNDSPVIRKKGEIAKKLKISNGALSQRIATIQRQYNSFNASSDGTTIS